MYINELAEAKILVIYAGRFQPFHQGHAWVYNYLTSKFGRNNVYVATTGKVEEPNSPFTFAERVYFMNLQGVPGDRILQIAQNYNVTAVKQAFNISDADLARYKVIFPVSQKDMDENPRFQTWTKKDGSAAALQPMPDDLSRVETMDRHGYILTVPTQPFKVLGKTITGATAIREEYINADERTRQQIIADVFGRYTREAEQIFNSKLLPPETVADTAKLPTKAKLQTVKQTKPVDYTDYEYSAESIKETTAFLTRSPRFNYGDQAYHNTLGPVQVEQTMPDGSVVVYCERDSKRYRVPTTSLKLSVNEMGGVGVVRGGNDPRYMTATMGDQNDVDSNTLNQEMAAYGLVGRKSPGGKTRQTAVKGNIGQGIQEGAVDDLEQRRIEDLNNLMDEIKHRISTESLPATYVQALKQRLLKLKAERDSYYKINT
jgi:hypothetical protein